MLIGPLRFNRYSSPIFALPQEEEASMLSVGASLIL